MSDVRAPAVVAVIVAHDPGPWFDEVLEAWAQQDYEELSVLVLVSGGEEDPTETIARHLPGAFVRRLETNAGFGAAINEAIGMVEGAAFLALCHDDCAPDPDAVHLMVEESYRSNAGIVTPKIVHFDDPSRLLHVGMNADKTGAVVGRVRPDEVDHGQHDTVRDVFVAPGGLNLVRSDLLVEIGGYDDGIVAMGEAHDRLSLSSQQGTIRLDQYLAAVLGGLPRKGTVRMELELAPTEAPFALAVPLGLILHELATNALKYAFPGDRPGLLRVALRRIGETIRLELSDDGVGTEWPPRSPGLGTVIVESMVQKLGAELSRLGEGGSVFRIDCPVQ
jgi:hypothetical protein